MHAFPVWAVREPDHQRRYDHHVRRTCWPKPQNPEEHLIKNKV